MTTYTATIQWTGEPSETFVDRKYSRAHKWHFDGGATVPASSSPHHVPLPFSDETAVDPEEAYVAALASCHMLGFLYFAARRGFVVTSYRDQPSGVMGKDESGREYITNVSLAPRVVFAADHAPADSDVEALHHEAHEACYLANSVKTTIDIHGGWERETPERKEYESRTSGAQ